jgi:hypothetical protein
MRLTVIHTDFGERLHVQYLGKAAVLAKTRLLGGDA